MMCTMGRNLSTDDLERAKLALAGRLREINDEIAHYPQPIARCDAQLGGLLEERLRLHAELEELQANRAK